MNHVKRPRTLATASVSLDTHLHTGHGLLAAVGPHGHSRPGPRALHEVLPLRSARKGDGLVKIGERPGVVPALQPVTRARTRSV